MAETRRRLFAGATVAAGLLLLAFGAVWRSIESGASARAIGLVVGSGVNVSQAPADVIVLSDGKSTAIALAITSQCSAGYLLGALAVCAGPLILVRRLSPLRVLTALGCAGAIIALVNVGRIVALALAVVHFDVQRGFALSHTYLGSGLTLLGTACGGIAFAAVLLMPGTGGRHAPAATQDI